MAADHPTPRLRSYMRAAARHLEQPAAPCPPDSELAGYAAGSGDAAIRERIQSHLMLCAECRKTVVEAAAFLESIPPAATPETAGGRRWPGKWAAMAAGLLAAISAGALWNLQRDRARLELRNRELQAQLDAREAAIAALRRPLANVPLYDIFPQDTIERSGAGPHVNRVDLAAGDTPVALILSGAGLPRLSSYRLEVIDSANKILWSSDGIRRDENGNFTLVLPPGFFPPGDYTIRLIGKTDAGSRALAEYTVAAVRPAL